MELFEHYLLNDDSDNLVPSEINLEDETALNRQNLPALRLLFRFESSIEINHCIAVRRININNLYKI